MSTYAHTRLFRDDNGTLIPGETLPAYLHEGNDYVLVDITVYRDGLIDWQGLVDFDSFVARVRDGRITTTVPERAIVRLPLGGVALVTEAIAVDVQDFIVEVRDRIEELNGRPTTLDQWLAAVARWRIEKTPENRDAALEALDRIPRWGMNEHAADSFADLSDEESQDLFGPPARTFGPPARTDG